VALCHNCFVVRISRQLLNDTAQEDERRDVVWAGPRTTTVRTHTSHVITIASDVMRTRLIDLRPCQHDDGYLDGRAQIKVHTDEWTRVHSAQSSLVVTHPSTNRARRYLTSVTESPSKLWSPLRTSVHHRIMIIIIIIIITLSILFRQPCGWSGPPVNRTCVI